MNTDALREAITNLDIAGQDLELLLVTTPAPQSKKRTTSVVAIDAPLGNALRSACERAVTDMKSRRQRDWDPRANPTSEEALFATGDVISETAVILEQLRAPNPEARGARAVQRDTTEDKVKMYAVAFGVGAQRMFFVQRRVETISASGKLVTRFVGDTMQLVREPSLVLPTTFEALLHPLGVVILRGDLFDRLLRDDESVAAEVGAHLAGLEARLPLDAASRQALGDVSTRYRYMRKRLASILAHPRFAELTPAEVRRNCELVGIETAVFFNGDAIRLDGENVDRFIRFLNDEVYRSVFGNELLAADGVAPF